MHVDYFAKGYVVLNSGEQNTEPLLLYYLQEYHEVLATMCLAKQYKSAAILREHRFYGELLLFPVDVCNHLIV
jgi:hypothetical protein